MTLKFKFNFKNQQQTVNICFNVSIRFVSANRVPNPPPASQLNSSRVSLLHVALLSSDSAQLEGFYCEKAAHSECSESKLSAGLKVVLHPYLNITDTLQNDQLFHFI